MSWSEAAGTYVRKAPVCKTRLRRLVFAAAAALGVCSTPVRNTTAESVAEAGPSDLYALELTALDGSTQKLAALENKVLLIVNTASQCGFTRQYKDLQEMYAKYRDQGLVILAFPSNDFGGQEPGSNQEIREFCSSKFAINFPIFDKQPVTGPRKQPLYKLLTERSGEAFAGEIQWNFEKFLVDRTGKVRARYGSFTNPTSSAMVAKIEELLSQGSTPTGGHP